MVSFESFSEKRGATDGIGLDIGRESVIPFCKSVADEISSFQFDSFEQCTRYGTYLQELTFDLLKNKPIFEGAEADTDSFCVTECY